MRDDGSLAVRRPRTSRRSSADSTSARSRSSRSQLLGLAQFVESVDLVAAAVRRGIASAGERAAGDRVARRVVCGGGQGDPARDRAGAARSTTTRARRCGTSATRCGASARKLRSTLEGLTRGRDTAKYLQDQIVTDRNGRYVVVVRAEHRDAIPGIVHGSSASGASLYLEPLATVDVNNDIVALAEREKEEIYRILLALTDAFRRARATTSSARSTPARRPRRAAREGAPRRSAWTASRPASRPTAASSSAARGIRC